MHLGKQQKGNSNFFTKRMALDAINFCNVDTKNFIAADIGSGAGELTKLLSQRFKKVFMADVYAAHDMPINAEFVYADLNYKWGLLEKAVDFLFALEVIEHIENPRHFFREITRVLKPG